MLPGLINLELIVSVTLLSQLPDKILVPQTFVTAIIISSQSHNIEQISHSGNFLMPSGLPPFRSSF